MESSSCIPLCWSRGACIYGQHPLPSRYRRGYQWGANMQSLFSKVQFVSRLLFIVYQTKSLKVQQHKKNPLIFSQEYKQWWCIVFLPGLSSFWKLKRVPVLVSSPILNAFVPLSMQTALSAVFLWCYGYNLFIFLYEILNWVIVLKLVKLLNISVQLRWLLPV